MKYRELLASIHKDTCPPTAREREFVEISMVPTYVQRLKPWRRGGTGRWVEFHRGGQVIASQYEVLDKQGYPRLVNFLGRWFVPAGEEWITRPAGKNAVSRIRDPITEVPTQQWLTMVQYSAQVRLLAQLICEPTSQTRFDPRRPMFHDWVSVAPLEEDT